MTRDRSEERAAFYIAHRDHERRGQAAWYAAHRLEMIAKKRAYRRTAAGMLAGVRHIAKERST